MWAWGGSGRAVAVRAAAFGMDVVAFDPTPETDFEKRHGVKRIGLDELLETSDIVSLHAPLVPATRGLIRAETLGQMKRGAWLINTARGGLVVEADLLESLRSGHIAGAGLDVLNQEPPDPANPLLRMSQVIVSPHVGGIDTLAMAEMVRMAAQSIVDLSQGRMPAEGCLVNPAIQPGWRWEQALEA